MKTSLLIILTAALGAACVSQNSTNSNAPATTQTAVNQSPIISASNHNGMNHGSMNHGEMQSAPDAANAPFDAQFLDTMIAHHAGAVEMARDALKRHEHPEIKTLANEIIKSQTAEIEQMRDWQTRWK